MKKLPPIHRLTLFGHIIYFNTSKHTNLFFLTKVKIYSCSCDFAEATDSSTAVRGRCARAFFPPLTCFRTESNGTL